MLNSARLLVLYYVYTRMYVCMYVFDVQAVHDVVCMVLELFIALRCQGMIAIEKDIIYFLNQVLSM